MNKLIIERTFNAPADEVWEALTDPEVLRRWWAPPGMSNSFTSVDLREGGRFRYCFKSDNDGQEFWGRGQYQKIEPPIYLSYLDSFTDAEGNDVAPAHYGMPGDDPVITLVELSLVEDGETTHLTLTGDNPFDEAMTADMTAGWNGMFDRLERLLQTT